MIYVHSGAAPFFLNGSPDQAILFLHGLTGSPSEVYPTAQYLNQHYGYTISGPLLPGHGSHPRFLNRTIWQDWFIAAEQELAFLRSNYKQVWVVGLSMGGLLAIHAASRVEGLQGAVSINAPFFPRGSFLMGFSPLIKRITPYHKKRNGDQVRELADRGRFTYDVMPVGAFDSMMNLRNTVRKEAPGITIPVLIIQASQDEVVLPKSGKHLAQKIPGAKLVRLELSQHIATMGEEIPLIAEAIGNFAKTKSI